MKKYITYILCILMFNCQPHKITSNIRMGFVLDKLKYPITDLNETNVFTLKVRIPEGRQDIIEEIVVTEDQYNRAQLNHHVRITEYRQVGGCIVNRAIMRNVVE